MQQTALSNHPGMWLDAPAAASLERLERSHGAVPISSAGRTVAYQQSLINRYDHPTSALDRPPYLYNPRRPANSGLHVVGLAIDTPWATNAAQRALLAEYGFMFNYAYDKVHVEYEANHDQHINDKPAKKEDTVIELVKETKGDGTIWMCRDRMERRPVSSADFPDVVYWVGKQFGPGAATVQSVRSITAFGIDISK